MRIGHRLHARRAIFDGSRCIALPGDIGTVEFIDPEGIPTVRFDRTGCASDCDTTELEAQ